MSGGTPFPLGFGFGPMPMPGPVNADPRRDPRRMQQLDDEQQRVLTARLLGAQMFHPGSSPARQNGFGDQDQGAGSDGGQSAPAQPQPPDQGADTGSQGWQGSSLLSTLFDRNPMGAPQSFAGTSGSIVQDQDGQNAGAQQGGSAFDMGALSMLGGGPQAAGRTAQPAPPYAETEDDVQQLERQQGSPEDLAALYGSAGRGGPAQAPQVQQAPPAMPSLLGAPTPQMPTPGGPQATGAISQQVAPGQQPASEDDEDPAPAVAPGSTAPGAGAAPTRAVPLPPVRPSELSAIDSAGPQSAGSFDPLMGQPVSGSPRQMGATAGSPGPGTAPSAAPGQGGKPEGPGFMEAWRRLADTGVGDQLIAFGSGLLSGGGAAGWAQAGQNMLGVSQRQGAGDLQRLEYGLKVQKLQQEQKAATANAQLIQQAFPNLTPEQVLGGAGNSTLVSAAIAKMQNPNAGRDIKTDANGVSRYTDTGAKVFADDDGTDDPKEVTVDGNKYWLRPNEKPSADNLIGSAQTSEERTATIKEWQEAKRSGGYTGKLQDWMRDRAQDGRDPMQLVDVPLGDGRTQKQWLKRGEGVGAAVGQPSPPDKPQNFDTESKLRGEFAKGIGTFQDVHDGYGRVIAATRQREANPGGVSPASDIGLVFGYMKMLDPGSVVREGEYATAANAAGIPERVRNAYNKAMKGEFLAPEQRQDFLGQAAELYSTARKTADGVAGRYRSLASQYGADPDRVTYLPEMPTPPTVGRDRMKPAGGQGGQQQAPTRQEAAQPPQGTPSGARQAPDGNWYVSDPNRPGKYLKVQ